MTPFSRMVPETLVFVKTHIFVFVRVTLSIVAKFNRVKPFEPVNCSLTLGPNIVMLLSPLTLRFNHPALIDNASEA